jgi:putative transposase
MRNKRYSVNQILHFLKMAESCTSIPLLAKSIDVSERTFYRWKIRYSTLGTDPTAELKRLRNENMLLKSLNVALLQESRQLIRVIQALSTAEEAQPSAWTVTN